MSKILTHVACITMVTSMWASEKPADQGVQKQAEQIEKKDVVPNAPVAKIEVGPQADVQPPSTDASAKGDHGDQKQVIGAEGKQVGVVTTSTTTQDATALKKGKVAEFVAYVSAKGGDVSAKMQEFYGVAKSGFNSTFDKNAYTDFVAQKADSFSKYCGGTQEDSWRHTSVSFVSRLFKNHPYLTPAGLVAAVGGAASLYRYMTSEQKEDNDILFPEVYVDRQ